MSGEERFEGLEGFEKFERFEECSMSLICLIGSMDCLKGLKGVKSLKGLKGLRGLINPTRFDSYRDCAKNWLRAISGYYEFKATNILNAISFRWFKTALNRRWDGLV